MLPSREPSGFAGLRPRNTRLSGYTWTAQLKGQETLQQAQRNTGGKLLVGQAGGTTAVINSSLVGVIEEAQRFTRFDAVWGMRRGLECALQAEFVDLTSLDPGTLTALAATPGAALASSRHRMTDDDAEQVLNGKTVRGSHDRLHGQQANHMVSAWACANRVVLAQVTVDAKSNEITALPELVGQLALAGCIVTSDAMGCQRQIAQQILDQGGDYVLALKGNQETLHEEVQHSFALAQQDRGAGVREFRTGIWSPYVDTHEP